MFVNKLKNSNCQFGKCCLDACSPTAQESTLTEPQDQQLPFACSMLSSIISQDRNRTMADRDEDIEHCLDLADELVRRYYARRRMDPEPTLELKPPVQVREVVIDRDSTALSALLAARRQQSERPPPRKPAG